MPSSTRQPQGRNEHHEYRGRRSPRGKQRVVWFLEPHNLPKESAAPNSTEAPRTAAVELRGARGASRRRLVGCCSDLISNRFQPHE
jgi:hypothetical protein